MHKDSVRLDDVMPLIKEQLTAGKSVRIAPQGTSMRPMIYAGRDWVTLSPLPEKLKKYDLPLYQRDDGKYVLHRITKVGQTYTCVGDNQFVYEDGLRHEQMIAVVTAFTRNGKTRSVSNLAYQIYCRVLHHSRALRLFCLKAGSKVKRLFIRAR